MSAAGGGEGVSQKMTIADEGGRGGKPNAYLIFVTSITSQTCGEKSVMWRNFRFLCVTNVEISEISPHVG